MTERARLVKFFEESLGREDVPGKLRKLSVFHVVKNKVGGELRSTTIPDEPDDEWMQKTADKIIEHASEEATTLRAGVQRYVVQALYQGDDQPHGRHVFAIDGNDDLANELDTHGPDADGLVGQAQGLTMFFAKELGRQVTYREKSLVEENAQLRKENAELRGDAVKRFKLLEELSSQKHQRELEYAAETAKQKRLDRAVDSLELMVPMAVNHMTGRKLLPEKAPEALLLKQLAEKMTPDMFTQVVATLGPELGATLFHLLQMVAKPAEAPTAPPAAAPSNGVAS